MVLQRLGVLLQQCSKTKTFKHGIILHAIIVKIGLEYDLVLSNHLINMYAKSNDLEASHQIFDGMSTRNLVSWSALISGYDQAGKPSMALSLFSQMKFQPNEYIYGSVFSACARLLSLIQGQQVHAYSIKTGYDDVSFVYNSLLSMYTKCGCFDDASRIFNITEPNSVTYNAMIAGFAEEQPDKGLELFRVLNHKGFRPDQFSYVAAFGICTRKEHFKTGLALHCQTVKLGLDSMPFVGNVILTMYLNFGSLGEVENAFGSIKEKDVITYNTFITACSQFGEHWKALMVYKDMTEMETCLGVSPDDFTLASALSACSELASIRSGCQIHAYLTRRKLDLDIGVYNALINMYAKCGSIQYSTKLFYHMPIQNLVSWNTMIIALGTHGHGKAAMGIFKQMEKSGLTPDSVTFVGLLTACNHAGMVDEGLACFNKMIEAYGISPAIEHLSCLIDILGRAGRVEEAESYLRISTFGDDFVIWSNLLSSCRLHKNIVVGERVANKLLELKPGISSPYVLLANLYASDGRWKDVAVARKLLKSSNVKKEPGYSLIEVNGISEKFTVKDFSHEKIREIIQTLQNLSWEIKELYM